MNHRPRRLLTAVLLAATLMAGRAEAAPRVVASVLPVQSLTAAVMGELGEPTLLLPGGASPHSYALRPSEALALQRAALIVRVGSALEGFLERPLATLGPEVRVLTLSRAPGVRLLPLREGTAWVAPEGEAEAHDEPIQDYDPHIWLDPANVRAMLAAIAEALSALDPANAATYAANAAAADARLVALDARLRERLRTVREVPYLVFHDAYQYFERAYGLRAVGAVTLDPELPAGARRLLELRALIEAQAVACLFSEPQLEPKLARVLVDGSGVRLGVLDPLGAALAPGASAYETLMENLGESLRGCLLPQS